MWIRRGVAVLLLLLAAPLARAGEAETRKEIEAFFTKLGSVLADMDNRAVAELIDYEALWSEICRHTGRDPMPPDQRDRALQGIRLGVSISGLDLMVGPWEDSEVRRVEVLQEGKAVVVLRRVLYADGPARERWWLSRSEEGEWRFYDHEDLAVGIRFTDGIAMVLGEIRSVGLEDARRVGPVFREAVEAMGEDDAERVRNVLSALDDLELPPRLSALRHILLAGACLYVEDHEPALAAAEAAAAQFPDLPVVLLLRGTALCGLSRHEEARQIAVQYRALTADGPEGILLEALALDGLGRTEEAMKLLFRGLTEEPRHADLLLEWGRLLPPERKGELAERFAALPKAQEWFEYLATEYFEAEDDAAVMALVAVLRKLAPEDPNADYYEAIVLSREGEHERAADLLLKAIPRVKDPVDRRYYEEVYLDEMVEREMPLAGFLAFPGDKAWAFEYLADLLHENGQMMKLISVVELHRESGVDTLLLSYYSGRVHQWIGLHDEAEEDYLAGWKRAVTEEDRERFRAALVENRHENGTGNSAYGEFGPRDRTFWHLARLHADDKDATGLKELLRFHEREKPNDVSLPFWRMEAAWIGQDHAEVIAIFLKHRAVVLAREDERWRSEDRIVRALVRAGRLDEALKEAALVDERQGDPWYSTMVWAAKGDAGNVKAGIEGILEAGYDLEDVYGDADLGPALRVESMKPVREMYPEPDR